MTQHKSRQHQHKQHQQYQQHQQHFQQQEGMTHKKIPGIFFVQNFKNFV
jgi:hypothetical protein